MSDWTQMERNRRAGRMHGLRTYRYWLLAATALALALLALRYGPALWALLRNQAALDQALAQLGWFGPAALVLINVLQIVVAPIPGYVTQAAALVALLALAAYHRQWLFALLDRTIQRRLPEQESL